jgi:single-strand DNA-binding protein
MASLNKVEIIGNLGRDPEVRYTSAGDAMCTLSVATTDTWKDKTTGEKREQTEWHRIVYAGRLAEVAGKYLRKGSQIYSEGSLRSRKWADKDGIEHFSTEIRADVLLMLNNTQRDKHASDSQAGNDAANNPAAYDNDVPF